MDVPHFQKASFGKLADSHIRSFVLPQPDRCTRVSRHRAAVLLFARAVVPDSAAGIATPFATAKDKGQDVPPLGVHSKIDDNLAVRKEFCC